MPIHDIYGGSIHEVVVHTSGGDVALDKLPFHSDSPTCFVSLMYGRRMDFKCNSIISSHLTMSEDGLGGATEVCEGVEVDRFHVENPDGCVGNIRKPKVFRKDSVIEVGHESRKEGGERAIREGAVESASDQEFVALHDREAHWFTQLSLLQVLRAVVPPPIGFSRRRTISADLCFSDVERALHRSGSFAYLSCPIYGAIALKRETWLSATGGTGETGLRECACRCRDMAPKIVRCARGALRRPSEVGSVSANDSRYSTSIGNSRSEVPRRSNAVAVQLRQDAITVGRRVEGKSKDVVSLSNRAN